MKISCGGYDIGFVKIVFLYIKLKYCVVPTALPVVCGKEKRKQFTPISKCVALLLLIAHVCVYVCLCDDNTSAAAYFSSLLPPHKVPIVLCGVHSQYLPTHYKLGYVCLPAAAFMFSACAKPMRRCSFYFSCTAGANSLPH